jgi:hypothetical protein
VIDVEAFVGMLQALSSTSSMKYFSDFIISSRGVSVTMDRVSGLKATKSVSKAG